MRVRVAGARSGWDGLPICSLMAAEGYRAMYVAPPQGSYEGRAGEYFQAVCVKGGDVLEDEGCFCAGVETPMLGGGNVCEFVPGLTRMPWNMSPLKIRLSKG